MTLFLGSLLFLSISNALEFKDCGKSFIIFFCYSIRVKNELELLLFDLNFVKKWKIFVCWNFWSDSIENEIYTNWTNIAFKINMLIVVVSCWRDYSENLKENTDKWLLLNQKNILSYMQWVWVGTAVVWGKSHHSWKDTYTYIIHTSDNETVEKRNIQLNDAAYLTCITLHSALKGFVLCSFYNVILGTWYDSLLLTS